MLVVGHAMLRSARSENEIGNCDNCDETEELFHDGIRLVRFLWFAEVMVSCASNPLRRCSVQTRLMHTT